MFQHFHLNKQFCNVVWCRYTRSQKLFNVDILDFQIELWYRVFAIFWLLFKKCANFFQSSGHPSSSNGPACLMQQKSHLNLSTSMGSSLKTEKILLVHKRQIIIRTKVMQGKETPLKNKLECRIRRNLTLIYYLWLTKWTHVPFFSDLL